jgi:CRISPR/Cas system-associated exonuclease Cas4 (RecB family)
MVAITIGPEPDPTLEAADRALEAEENAQPPRPYLGMSALGGACERRLWYGFRHVNRTPFPASTLRLFRDGHRSEDLQAEDLRRVPGVELATVDPATGEQWAVVAGDGHIKGHLDGFIKGILQAPNTVHVWEHKATNEAKFGKLEALKAKLGEKNALRVWNPVYYAQAVLYMHCTGIKRHYMTVSTPGVRRSTSVRTAADPLTAETLLDKGERIVNAPVPPPRISEDPSAFECRYCDFRAVCRREADPGRNCRTCRRSAPDAGGTWACQTGGALAVELTVETQRQGCGRHAYIPALVPGTPIAKDADGDWISYRLPDGSIWTDAPDPPAA